MTEVLADDPMLASYQTIRTSLVDEAERAVARSLSVHRLANITGELDLVHNVALLGHVSLHYIDYGAALTILLDHAYDPFYLVQLPLRGNMLVRVGGKEIEASPGSAIITEPGRATTLMQFDEHCARLMVKIPAFRLKQRREQLRLPGQEGHVFSVPVLDLESGPGKSWAELVRVAVADLESGAGLHRRSQAAAFFENVIVDGLLLSRPEQSAILGTMSRAVADAINFIDAHLADPLTVDEIAAATHMSVRALQVWFRKDLGASPMDFVRKRRLDAIHEELLRCTGPSSVGAIANRYGVSHMGRFAAAYRERFGVSPSETARGKAQDAAPR